MRRGIPATFGAAAIVLIAAAPARAAKVENLQRLGTRSFYAFVEQAAKAKQQPKTSAKTIARLTRKTGEGTDDLVAVIARTTDSRDRVWYKVRLPVRPNNTTAWVEESALSELQPVDSWIRVSTKTFKITVIKKGKRVFSASVGVGQPQWPTPRGQFYIRAKLSNFNSPFYGPLAYVTSATSDKLTDWPGGGIVGIHGTSLPNLIPGKISHGCVRVRNADIRKVDSYVEVGTPITIT